MPINWGAGGNPYLQVRGVRESKELERILSLPRRDPDELGRRLVNGMTKRFRTPGGTQTLRPMQALALAEAHDLEGGFGPLSVGSGKTIIALLLPVVLKAERPMLLAPAKHLVDKYPANIAEFRKHWQYNENLKLFSYEGLSRQPQLLDRHKPDLIIADEAHHLANPSSKRCGWLRKYGKANPVLFIPLSGTMIDRHFHRYYHLQQWSLPKPLHILPFTYPEFLEWGEALDSKVDWRRPLGALEKLGPTLEEAQAKYGDIMRHTPGVWVKKDPDCSASIEVTVLEWRHPKIQEESRKMRSTWTRPDGETFSEATQHWAHQRQLGNGFWYSWKHPAPEPWLLARRDWAQFALEKQNRSPNLFSAKDVALAFPDSQILARWRAIKDTFKAETVATWFTYDVLDYAASWLREKPKRVVWVEHREVGFELERRHGIPFFHEQARTSDGRSIVSYPGGPVALSVHAIGDGFDLQDRWNQSLFLNAPPTGERREQLLGRTHRPGQLEDTVFATFLVCVPEQMGDFDQAMADARRSHTMDQPQKLCLADIIHVRREGV